MGSCISTTTRPTCKTPGKRDGQCPTATSPIPEVTAVKRSAAGEKYRPNGAVYQSRLSEAPNPAADRRSPAGHGNRDFSGEFRGGKCSKADRISPGRVTGSNSGRIEPGPDHVWRKSGVDGLSGRVGFGSGCKADRGKGGMTWPPTNSELLENASHVAFEWCSTN
ncbi:DCD (Development and Cell Death) domain protein [Striga asiatica]|uniref:DCD (Development and Cell Death) domain protein n=1 Tax=Striga asiatica TaxID=4170 RepID=A0A5A7PH63_STRAF|nr:DCD (Development and Cell Death) domain protein [Striga asiatica]